MANNGKGPIRIKSYSLYDEEIATIDGHAKEMGYGSASAALRRILFEWEEYKAIHDEIGLPVRVIFQEWKKFVAEGCVSELVISVPAKMELG